MNYLQKKKLAFMSIVNSVKGFVRNITGVFPLTLTNCVDSRSIIDYTMYGNSVQNGTPTPDTPIEVESVGEYDETTGKYKIPIKVSGKNLFDINKVTNSWGVVEYNGVQCLKYTDTSQSNQGAFKYTDNFKKNTRYTFAVKIYDEGANKNTALKFVYTDGSEYSLQIAKMGVVYKYTTSANKTLKYIIAEPAWGISRYMDLTVTQLEKGTTATDYEPYHEPITTNIYLDEPLRKVGDYADYIDFENGKVIRNVKSRMLTSDLEWVTTYSEKAKNYYHYCYVNDITQNITNDLSLLCSHYLINVRNTSDIDNRIGFRLNLNGFFVTDSTYTNVEEFKSFIEANDIEVVYPSYSEETIELPPIPTFKGTSIISTDTTIQPSNAEIEYYSNVKE